MCVCVWSRFSERIEQIYFLSIVSVFRTTWKLFYAKHNQMSLNNRTHAHTRKRIRTFTCICFPWDNVSLFVCGSLSRSNDLYIRKWMRTNIYICKNCRCVCACFFLPMLFLFASSSNVHKYICRYIYWKTSKMQMKRKNNYILNSY